MTRTKIPSYAADYPDVAVTLEQARLPFYCINCYRKRETVYITPNFGPFCDECLQEARIWQASKQPSSEPFCYVDHATGDTDHMNAHIRTSACDDARRI